MNTTRKNEVAEAIAQTIQAKREGRFIQPEEIASREASLLADIESFDLEAAERKLRAEQSSLPGRKLADPTLTFPKIVPEGVAPHPHATQRHTAATQGTPAASGSLLDQLRQQAEQVQQAEHHSTAARTVVNEAVDQALKRLFFYLHDFTQQLNILKPAIGRSYTVVDTHVLEQLTWQDGFVDYRAQEQSAGALVELVTMTYHLKSPQVMQIERDGIGIERLRNRLFDVGLRNTCQEFRNERRHVERASFKIPGELSVSIRWRADFEKGVILNETRNLERLGPAVFVLHPDAVDHLLMEDFGRLILAQPNRFRELLRR